MHQRQMMLAINPGAVQVKIKIAVIGLGAWGREIINTLAKVPQASIDAFAADLKCTIDVAEAKGARVVLATHATYFGAGLRPQDRPMMVAWRRFYSELGEDGFLDLEQRTNAVVRGIAQAHGLALADAAPALPPGPEHFADFVHFTDAGAGRMADLLAQAIIARP